MANSRFRLGQLRMTATGLSAKAIAKKIHVTEVYMYRVESGIDDPSDDLWVKLAAVYRMPASGLKQLWCDEAINYLEQRLARVRRERPR